MLAFQFSTIASNEESDVSTADARELLVRLQARPAWDSARVTPKGDSQFPLLNLSWHEGDGFVVQCFETPQSNSDFLLTGEPLSSPEVYVELGGQTQELWPRQLFVPLALAAEALKEFLESGRQSPSLLWIPIDRFPRRTVRPRRPK
jgi:hypothetical protein